MLSFGTTTVFSKVSGALKSGTYTVDNAKAILLQVATGSGAASSQKLKVLGSIGFENGPSTPIDPGAAASIDNPYSPLMLRDLDSMEAITGTDGLSPTPNAVRLFEINVSAVRDVHFELVNAGFPVSVRIRPYHEYH